MANSGYGQFRYASIYYLQHDYGYEILFMSLWLIVRIYIRIIFCLCLHCFFFSLCCIEQWKFLVRSILDHVFTKKKKDHKCRDASMNKIFFNLVGFVFTRYKWESDNSLQDLVLIVTWYICHTLLLFRSNIKVVIN